MDEPVDLDAAIAADQEHQQHMDQDATGALDVSVGGKRKAGSVDVAADPKKGPGNATSGLQQQDSMMDTDDGADDADLDLDEAMLSMDTTFSHLRPPLPATKLSGNENIAFQQIEADCYFDKRYTGPHATWPQNAQQSNNVCIIRLFGVTEEGHRCAASSFARESGFLFCAAAMLPPVPC